jgi:RNA polymerase sigma factor (sigma-70 family)
MSEEQDQARFQIDRYPQGQSETLAGLRTEYHSVLLSTLIARGATPIEAEDIMADLWGDCVGRRDGQPSLLEKFSGKCPIQNWLATVATHRLVDLKRRESKHRGELPTTDTEQRDRDSFERLAAPSVSESESGLVVLLKESLHAAFAKCPGESMLMLRLVYLNGLSQREVGRMWGWHESKVSRSISHAMALIETSTLHEVKRRDPWLDLAWSDFLALCESHEIGFL